MRQKQVVVTVVGGAGLKLRDAGLSCEWAEPDEDPASFLASSDLLILPRIDLNRTATLLEARAHDLPVLACDSDEIRPLVTHGLNGWLVKRPGERAFAEAVAWLAANPGLVRDMGWPGGSAKHDSVAVVVALYERVLAAKAEPPGPAQLEPHAALRARCEAITCEAAERYLQETPQQLVREDLARAGRALEGTWELLNGAQRSLERIAQRQQQIASTPRLPPTAAVQLKKLQKSITSLRNKLKWRSRRLRLNGQSLPAVLPPTLHPLPPLPADIPLWARCFHALFAKDHWMKHGRKQQYPPRPLQPERFPAPTLPDGKLPRIAVVTPSFGQGSYLEQTILSVINQDYPNLAYAVQDGGSTDNTLDVIRRHADRITVWSSHPDSGQARAIATGFERIQGDIMAWLNSDDLFVPGALRYIGEYFAKHPGVDVIYGHRIIIDEGGREVARWVLPPHNPQVTPYVDPVPQETLFWRASMWERVGGIDTSFRFALDWDLVTRFQNAGANIVRLPYFLGCFRVHSQQKLSVQVETVGAEESALLRRRETGRFVQAAEIDAWRKWMEVHGAIYARLLEWGIRI